MGTTYAVATNSDVLFAKGWFDGMRHALEHGWDYVGPLTNAPGPPNFAFQDVRFYNRCYAPQDTETALSETQCELRQRYPPDMAITAMVNGFCQVAKTIDVVEACLRCRACLRPCLSNGRERGRIPASAAGEGRKDGRRVYVVRLSLPERNPPVPPWTCRSS